MAIQWFPGHMNAARRKAAETMEMTDLVIEVLDARLPAASSNPMVDELRRHRRMTSMRNPVSMPLRFHAGILLMSPEFPLCVRNWFRTGADRENLSES